MSSTRIEPPSPRRVWHAAPLHTRSLGCWAIAMFACGSSEKAPTPPPDSPPEPRRTAAEAGDLRVMFAELTASRACDRLRNMFRPIGGGEDTAVIGTMWIQECEASEQDATVTLQLAGRGWRFVDRTTEKAGAAFEVLSYVPFKFSVEVDGTIDVAYARKAHVFTAWFTPRGSPKATFEPIGEVEVETDGLWSSVVGGLASTFSSSPEERAEDKVSKRGGQELEKQFARGFAATIDMCSGQVRTGLGHPKAGEMLGPSRSIRDQAATLHAGGLLLDGPILLPKGGVEIEVKGGSAVLAELVCEQQAVELGEAFLEGGALPTVKAVASAKVRDRATLDAPSGTSCPLILSMRPLDRPSGPIQVSYEVNLLTAKLAPLATCAKRDAPQAD